MKLMLGTGSWYSGGQSRRDSSGYYESRDNEVDSFSNTRCHARKEQFGEIIDVQHVKKGEVATAPDNIRVPEGYIFEDWDGNYNNVQQNLILNPVYSVDIDYVFDQITDITDWMERGYNDEKIQTAKLLLIHIINDEELCELGADLPWVCGVLASMCMEGIPGLFEGNSPYDYLRMLIRMTTISLKMITEKFY